MKIGTNKLEQESLDLSESSREDKWEYPSFVKGIFKGNIDWNMISPFPNQDEEDKKKGDEVIKKVEEVLKKHIDPHEVEINRKVPKKALEALAEIGCFGIKIPQKYGGLGLSITNYNRIMEVVGSHCASTAIWLSAHQSIGAPQPILLFGTQKQKEEYLPRLAKGEVSAFALTEPNVGSDPAKMETTATPSSDGKHYILNGKKMWISNGPDAKILVVMAKTPSIYINGEEKKQVTTFIVETDTEGFRVENECSFMGIKGISNGVLKFDNLKIPKENIVGKLGEGLKIGFVTLNTGRMTIPAMSSAIGKLCLKYSREWVRERVQWGKPIGKHQAIKTRVSKIAANTFAIEAILKLTSSFADKKQIDIRLEAAMAKYFSSEIAWEIIDDTLQIRGGRGYETEDSLKNRGEKAYPIERMFRDCRINRIIEGTSDIMQLFIAREAMDTHLKKLMPILDSSVKNSQKVKTVFKAFGFYSKWYPKQWTPSISVPSKKLTPENKKHLQYVFKTSKKLSRVLFHTMAKYQQKLESEENLIACFVDIGTRLFAMSATLSYAQSLYDTKLRESSGELAEAFCDFSKTIIEQKFNEISGNNNNKTYDKIGLNFFDEKYSWLEEGVMQEDKE